jgi:hypothetical protein
MLLAYIYAYWCLTQLHFQIMGVANGAGTANRPNCIENPGFQYNTDSYNILCITLYNNLLILPRSETYYPTEGEGNMSHRPG